MKYPSPRSHTRAIGRPSSSSGSRHLAPRAVRRFSCLRRVSPDPVHGERRQLYLTARPLRLERGEQGGLPVRGMAYRLDPAADEDCARLEIDVLPGEAEDLGAAGTGTSARRIGTAQTVPSETSNSAPSCADVGQWSSRRRTLGRLDRGDWVRGDEPVRDVTCDVWYVCIWLQARQGLSGDFAVSVDGFG
jgi:hypothetical protein